MSDANKIIGIETKDINKIDGIEGKNIAKLGNTPVSFTQIPAGLIVFLNDISVPAGWEAFNSANDRMIIGAGSTYAVGATGGAQYSGGITTGSAGSHTSTNHGNAAGNMAMYFASPDSSGQQYAQGTYGAHTHSASVAYNVAKDKILLIKAILDLSQFPINTVVPSQAALSGLSSLSKDYLIASTSLGAVAEIKTATLSSSGNHYHQQSVGTWGSHTSGELTGIRWNSGGAHSPSATLNPTPNLKRLLLSLWTNASASFDPIQNMIGMWESLTPPDGWLICNGSNGTPDLRDSFIKPVDSGSENITPQGNNTLNYTVSTSHSSTHNHQLSLATRRISSNSTGTWNYSWSHNHGSPGATPSWLPPYYALSFIMKAA